MASARLQFSPHPSMTHTEQGDSPISPSPPSAGKGRKVLLPIGQLPSWHQDNKFILHGYRPISGSARLSFRSWSYIHNESVNIYSHLIPAVVFLLGEWYILQYLTSRYSHITGVDIFIISFFLLTAVICLGLSTTYHTLMNHSREVDQFWLRFDLVGIVVLTLGDFVSGIYMIFWCEPLERRIYWSMVSQDRHPFLSSGAYFWLADWSSRVNHHLHYGKSLFPRQEIPCFSRACVCRHWLIWLCTLNPWDHDVRLVTNDEAIRNALLSGRSGIPFVWGLGLCRKPPDFASYDGSMLIL